MFAWPSLLKCFVVGGLLCVIGQILIDKTKLTPARVLVIFVTTGAILGGLGIYQYLVNFAGAGATVPLTGFGYNLAKGALRVLNSLVLLVLLLVVLKLLLVVLLLQSSLDTLLLWFLKPKNEKTVNFLIALWNKKAIPIGWSYLYLAMKP